MHTYELLYIHNTYVHMHTLRNAEAGSTMLLMLLRLIFAQSRHSSVR